MGNTTAKLSDLFIDATREVIEKGRIKSQINRLERIMDTDRARLRSVYADIGKMYIEGTLSKNKGKLEYACKEIKHLNLRLERAEARYEQLQEAHSVDECKEAFRAELSAKIKEAQDNTAIAAYNLKKKAKNIVSGNASQAVVRIKDKAVSTADAIAQRTTKKSKKAAEENEELSFTDLLAELDIEDTDIDDIDLTSDESAEVTAILDNLDAILTEVEEEATESAIATESDTTPDGESAESFDF
ncbi:MAG: hypothetical protein IKJ83_03355 [Ruminococcus sp.]|nr:hypothetical protein [Ruminococcus sp.]